DRFGAAGAGAQPWRADRRRGVGGGAHRRGLADRAVGRGLRGRPAPPVPLERDAGGEPAAVAGRLADARRDPFFFSARRWALQGSYWIGGGSLDRVVSL